MIIIVRRKIRKIDSSSTYRIRAFLALILFIPHNNRVEECPTISIRKNQLIQNILGFGFVFPYEQGRLFITN